MRVGYLLCMDVRDGMDSRKEMACHILTNIHLGTHTVLSLVRLNFLHNIQSLSVCLVGVCSVCVCVLELPCLG